MNYLGLATQIIGTELQGWANKLAAQEMGQQFSQEQVRQRKYANEARGAWTPSVEFQGRENFDKMLGESAASRRDLYSDVAERPFSFEGGPSATDRASHDMKSLFRSNLLGYGDVSLENSMNRLRTQQELDRISNFAGGTASVFPYRMYEAQHKYDWLAAIGSAISSLGGGGGGGQQPVSAPPLSQGNTAAYFGGQGPQAASYAPYQPWTPPNSSFGQMAGWPQMFM